jgi:hypothetical protein
MTSHVQKGAVGDLISAALLSLLAFLLFYVLAD